MSNTAFEISEEDVSLVLSSNSLAVANSDGKSFDTMATELIHLLNLDEIEGAALYGDTLDEQTNFAHDEITRQLRNLGVLEQSRGEEAFGGSR